MKTSHLGRTSLLQRQAEARATPIEASGSALQERKSKAAVAIVTAKNPKLASAKAKYIARACSMAPYLVRDIEELIGRMQEAQACVAAEMNKAQAPELLKVFARLNDLLAITTTLDAGAAEAAE